MDAMHSDYFKMGLDAALLTGVREKPLKVSKKHKALIIGAPRETHNQEARVALSPGAVGVLVANGHQVIVEHNAGKSAQFQDREYSDNGAVIAYTKEEVYSRSQIVTKINPLAEDEYDLLQFNQTLFSAVHLGNVNPTYLKVLLEKKITAVGFEFLQAPDGSIPVMRSMSEIAGATSIHIASELMSRHTGGKGVLLGGVTGIPPALVTIIGAGNVGYYATKTALGLGAMVKVLDEEIYRLRRLEEALGMKVFTAVSQQNYVEDAVLTADVVIGAAYKPGFRSPCVVTEEMVARMRDGSVIVDVSIDQGGTFETSRPTSHDKPTYVTHGVIHYCVPNIASRVSRTASLAISNVLTPLLIKIGDWGGLDNAIGMDTMMRSGVYVYKQHLTQRSLAAMFNMDFMDIDLLYAASII